MNKKNFLQLFIIVVLIFSFTISLFVKNSNVISKENEKNVDNHEPKTSEISILNYLDHKYLGFDSTTYDLWTFNFSSSNVNVNITVFAVNDEEYSKFLGGQPAYKYNLSKNKISDLGSFVPPYDDIWFVVLYNDDSDMESTLLTYTIDWISNYFW